MTADWDKLGLENALYCLILFVYSDYMPFKLSIERAIDLMESYPDENMAHEQTPVETAEQRTPYHHSSALENSQASVMATIASSRQHWRVI